MTNVEQKCTCPAFVPGFHDQMMLHSAVLSGDENSMVRAARSVRLATRDATEHQYDAALAGLMASRILQKKQDELAQSEILLNLKPTGIDAHPSVKTIRAFTRRDYTGLRAAVVSAVDKYSSEKHLGRAAKGRGKPIVIKEGPDYVLLDLSRQSSRLLWPYPEASLAKLALRDGANYDYDSFWLPLAYLQGASGEDKRLQRQGN